MGDTPTSPVIRPWRIALDREGGQLYYDDCWRIHTSVCSTVTFTMPWRGVMPLV